jgi:hypothetical protein
VQTASASHRELNDPILLTTLEQFIKSDPERTALYGEAWPVFRQALEQTIPQHPGLLDALTLKASLPIRVAHHLAYEGNHTQLNVGARVNYQSPVTGNVRFGGGLEGLNLLNDPKRRINLEVIP